jgi:RNA polymerase sigma-70 factor (ECF subfamily)
MDQGIGFAIRTGIVDFDGESALLAAAREGDATCFGTLLSRYGRKIFRIARNITHDESDAEEVTQDALWKAFQHLEDFKGDSRCYTWLVRIAINQALMKVRKRPLNHVSLDNPPDTEADFIPRNVEDKGLTPEQRYSQTELAEILTAVIDDLNPTLRIVFQLPKSKMSPQRRPRTSSDSLFPPSNLASCVLARNYGRR